jgi:hypothetical protein
MKQVKLNQFEAAMILILLKEVDRRETFRNDAPGAVFQYENCTRNMILTLEQLLKVSQSGKRAA